MNDRRNRAAVKRRLVYLGQNMGAVDLGASGRTAEAIPVSYDIPPDEATETCLYFGGQSSTVEGDSAATGMRSSKAPSSDDYRIPGTLDVFGFDSCPEAEEAAERAFDRFEAVLNGCQRLVDQVGSIDPQTPADYDVQSAYIATASLLSGVQVGDTWAARYSFTVQCRTEIQR